MGIAATAVAGVAAVLAVTGFTAPFLGWAGEWYAFTDGSWWWLIAGGFVIPLLTAAVLSGIGRARQFTVGVLAASAAMLALVPLDVVPLVLDEPPFDGFEVDAGVGFFALCAAFVLAGVAAGLGSADRTGRRSDVATVAATAVVGAALLVSSSVAFEGDRFWAWTVDWNDGGEIAVTAAEIVVLVVAIVIVAFAGRAAAAGFAAAGAFSVGLSGLASVLVIDGDVAAGPFVLAGAVAAALALTVWQLAPAWAQTIGSRGPEIAGWVAAGGLALVAVGGGTAAALDSESGSRGVATIESIARDQCDLRGPLRQREFRRTSQAIVYEVSDRSGRRARVHENRATGKLRAVNICLD